MRFIIMVALVFGIMLLLVLTTVRMVLDLLVGSHGVPEDPDGSNDSAAASAGSHPKHGAYGTHDFGGARRENSGEMTGTVGD